jgi:iron(III) transport system ATP-binding protein
VLLMDEPLSNLDAKLRLEMRQAIRKIQREVGITTVYVTHDQEEAMSISDTIAVMNAGKIQHIGTPRDIYQRPANTFVATFIGRTNILDARMEQGTLVFPTGERFTRDSWRTIPDGPVKVSVRPEEFVVHHADEKAGGLSAVLEDSVYLGLNTHYYLKLTGGASVELIQESAIDEKLEPGSAVTLTLKEEKINIFSEDGTKNYLRG